MLASQPRKRVLFVSANDKLVDPALRIIESAGNEVACVRSAQQARAWFRLHQADLAAIDLADDDEHARSDAATLVHDLRNPSSTAAGDVLALTRLRLEAQTRQLFRDGLLTNFLGVDEDGSLDPLELGATVTKILSADIFGLDKYLAPGAKVETYFVRQSTERDAIIDRAEALAQACGCHAEIAKGAATAADELLTNALYNAPTDTFGKPRHAHLSRTIPVELPEHEEIRFQLAHDGQRIGMSVRDPFGSLAPERVVEYLSRCFSRADYEVPMNGGGAGLGLYYIFNLVQHFVINIAPGTCTEAIGLFRVSGSMRRFSAKTKSFNVFVARSA